MTKTALATAEPDDWKDLAKRFYTTLANGTRLLADMDHLKQPKRGHRSVTMYPDTCLDADDRSWEVISDGFGNEWPRCGDDCDIEVVRPGKAQCSGTYCDDLGGWVPEPDPEDEYPR